MVGLMVAVFGLLAGCTGPVAPASPVWTPTLDPVESVTPTLVSPWTAEEQVVVDAVTRYLAEWSRIGQDLEAADWNDIRDVATDPAAEQDLLMWSRWQQNGWHLVGAQTFGARAVTFDRQDDFGAWYFVDGCTSIVGSDLVDANGQSVGGSGRRDITVDRYSVAIATSQGVLVADSQESPEGVNLQC